jgi:hypothetical protein
MRLKPLRGDDYVVDGCSTAVDVNPRLMLVLFSGDETNGSISHAKTSVVDFLSCISPMSPPAREKQPFLDGLVARG